MPCCCSCECALEQKQHWHYETNSRITPSATDGQTASSDGVTWHRFPGIWQTTGSLTPAPSQNSTRSILQFPLSMVHRKGRVWPHVPLGKSTLQTSCSRIDPLYSCVQTSLSLCNAKLRFGFCGVDTWGSALTVTAALRLQLDKPQKRLYEGQLSQTSLPPVLFRLKMSNTSSFWNFILSIHQVKSIGKITEISTYFLHFWRDFYILKNYVLHAMQSKVYL